MPRNAAGVYTLPNPPVVTDTTIESDDENETRDDIAAELTNSLSRSGQGGMLAPFRIADGIEVAPGLSFLNDPDSGLYRSSADTWHLVAGATTQATVNTSGFGVKAAATATNPFVANFVATQPASSQVIRALGTVTQNANTAQTFSGLAAVISLDMAGFNNTAVTANGGGIVGFNAAPTVTGAGTMNNFFGIFSSPRNVGLGTITLMTGFTALPVNSGGGVVDAFYGFYVPDHAVGTRNAAFGSAIAAGAGKWGLYMGGTANNFLLGPLTQGIADLLIVEGLVPTVQVWDGIAALNRFSANGVGNTLYFNKSRGNNYATFSVLALNDDIASLKFMGSDGVTLQQAAAILVEVAAVPVAGAVPGRFTFQVADISGAQVNAATITSTDFRLNTTLTSIVFSGANIDMANVGTNATAKISNIRGMRFANVDTPFIGMRLVDDGIDNIVTIGGGSSSHGAATQLQFRTTSYVPGGAAGIVRAAVLTTGEWVFGSLVQAQEVDGFSAPVQVNSNSGANAMSFNKFIANSSGNLMYFSKSRGANLGQYNILVANDDIQTFWFFGADGTALRAAAAILVEVDVAPVANVAVPGRIIFQTTNLAGVLTEAMRIDSKNNIRLNGAAVGTNAEGVLALGRVVTIPGTSVANGIQLFCLESSVGVNATTLAIRTNYTVEAIGTFTPTSKGRIIWNGVEYWIQLDPVI